MMTEDKTGDSAHEVYDAIVKLLADDNVTIAEEDRQTLAEAAAIAQDHRVDAIYVREVAAALQAARAAAAKLL